ncbi:MAG TPA: DUF1566 domain-containing protein [Gammaproteobacteria bacterium]|nr:DUF1566 domain-containing protein [Gammaproteobacteria bacterium]
MKIIGIKLTGIMALIFFLAIPEIGYSACNPDILPTKPDSIYIDNQDGTVTDTKTGLMWKQCSEGQTSTASACDNGYVNTFTWQMALKHTEEVNSSGGFAGYTDWRLPNYRELASLVEYQCVDPAINSFLFPHTMSVLAPGLIKGYWTSSPYMGRDVSRAVFSWVTYFSTGVTHPALRSETNMVRLVRGGY